jgi:hypothetical protein
MPSTSASPASKRGPVRITLPASIAFNLGALKETVTSAMERLTCPTCFSGYDCHFAQQRDLLVDEEKNITANPDPVPWTGVNPPPVPWSVAVGFQGNTAYNIDLVLKTVENVAGSLGCLPCHSGWNVSYYNEVILIGINPAGQATTYAGQTAS